jgi:hypothetical protein
MAGGHSVADSQCRELFGGQRGQCDRDERKNQSQQIIAPISAPRC